MGLRMDIGGTHNFRDVGGYRARTGWTRSGQLYRSDSLCFLTASGAADLAMLRIGVVVDLRSRLELGQDHSGVQLPGATWVHVPIHGGSHHSILEGDGISLERLYRQILLDSAWSIATAIAVIAESGSTPVLVNCTAGKDRTGLVVALALDAAGVDRDAVVADYTQSALNLDGAWLDTTMTRLVSNGVPISPRLFEAIGGSPDHAMTRLLEWLDHAYGSAEGFLRAHEVPDDTIESLREKLVG